MDWDAATGVGGLAPVGREHKPNGQNPVGPLRASWRSSAVGGIQAWAMSSGRRARSQPTLLHGHRGELARTSPETRELGGGVVWVMVGEGRSPGFKRGS